MRLRTLPPPVALSRGGRLSEGALVEAHVRARLLGIPLLKLDALVALVPANPTAGPPTAPASFVERTVSSGNRSRELDAPGSALADAIRSIDEAAELLAQSRRNGSG